MIDLTKTYRTRDGRAVTDLRPRTGGIYTIYPLQAEVSSWGLATFTEQGAYLSGETDDLDLIAIEEAPAASVPDLHAGRLKP